MPRANDLSRSLDPFEQGSCLVAVIELSQASWLIAGTVPGIERQPLKKITADETALLRLLHRWRDEATRSGRPITRIAVAFEAGRDGFWLARWLRGHGVEAHVIHPTSVAVSREHKRAKTDRLDTAMLMRVFLGWLRGERGHCGMVAVPTIEEEDARRPSRERETLVGERTRIVNRMKAALARLGIRGFKPELRKAPRLLESLRTPEGGPIPPNTLDEMRRELARLAILREQIVAIEQARLERLQQAPQTEPQAMVRPPVSGKLSIVKRWSLISRWAGWDDDMAYSAERKAAVLKKMLPPNTVPLRQLSREEGICEATLHSWRKEARSKGQLLPDADAGPEGWSSRDKFAAVVETADMLVQEVLSRHLRDRRAVARYAGLTGSPDESGSRRREKGLSKSGNARVRRGLIQLAWRFLIFQKDSALAQWFRSRTEGAKGARKTTMIVALARKLLIALWRMVSTGEVPQGVVLRQPAWRPHKEGTTARNATHRFRRPPWLP